MINKVYFIFLFVVFSCGTYSQNLSYIIDSVKTENLMNSIKELSGFVPVIIDGKEQTIITRHSEIYRQGNLYARKYIQQKFAEYGIQSTIQSFKPDFGGENVIAEIPGYMYPSKKYIISAHYDDEPYNFTYAPGADDNASGVAAVLEAARILKNYSFPYTIAFILFDEEEHALGGSLYYVQNASTYGDSILGDINLDMIGYDSNNDNAAELNSKDTALSHLMSTKILEINRNYQIGINFRYISNGRGASDHQSFWQYGYTANWLEEDHTNDFNIKYHTSSDSITYINPEFLTKMSKVAIGSLASLATDGYVLPVELNSFTASIGKNQILIKWGTSSEINNLGFDIQRSVKNKDWETIGFVKGAGNCNSPRCYEFIDKNVNENKSIRYRLKQFDTDNNFEYSNEIEVEPSFLVKTYRLDQNFPNPFNPSTTIKFVFDTETKAELIVYDILGNKIIQLYNGTAEAGNVYNINFNASDYSSGVYYYKLTGNGITDIKKMVLIK